MLTLVNEVGSTPGIPTPAEVGGTHTPALHASSAPQSASVSQLPSGA
jgi:hypothetical protein